MENVLFNLLPRLHGRRCFFYEYNRIKNGNAYDNRLTKDTELQNEYNYILAENLTKKLLDKEVISEDEFNKIMEKNKAVFSPFFSRI